MRETVERAVGFARERQRADGCWRIPPEPRALENALVVYALQRLAIAPLPMAQARAWLRANPPNPPAAGHTGAFVHGVEHWLWQAACLGCAPPLLAELSRFRHPQAARRLRMIRALAAEAGLLAETELLSLREELSIGLAKADEAKPWSAAEDAALYLVVTPAETALTDTALQVIEKARAHDGSIAANPISTVLALWGATRAGAAVVAATLLDALLALRVEGTWRFCTTEIWDTALLTRSLLLANASSGVVEPARRFLRTAQNADGGWGYAPGRDSDVDTSAMAMLVMDRSTTSFERAYEYLVGRRDGDGLWRTWHDKRDSVAIDVVAHAVAALMHADSDPTQYARAREFLAGRCEKPEGWRADWYDNRLYAGYEIGTALPRHPHTKRFVVELATEQNVDGGFSPSPNAGSTPAATGCALALLCSHVEPSNPTLLRALDYLLLTATADGTWPGPTGMYGPRPFLSDYAMQTHALTLLGTACALRELTSDSSTRALRSVTLDSAPTLVEDLP